MKTVYTSPVFWSNTFDRSIRTSMQFGIAFLVSIFGESASSGFDSARIDFLLMGGWMLSGLIISILTSLAFPAKVLNEPHPDNRPE